MPLSMMQTGEEKKIVKINGKDETRQFLENLGFSSGSDVKVVSKNSGNLIVQVRETRIALDSSMANRIMV